MSLLQDSLATDDGPRYSDEAGVVQITRVEKKENILEKSIVRLKETGTVRFNLLAFLSWKYYLNFIHLHLCIF